MSARWVSWADFHDAAPELAEFGKERLAGSAPAYLATVRGGALPRVHPVQPIVSPSRLLLFMFPTSPKAHDLQSDGRFGLHCAVADNDGSGGEFFLRGRARLVTDGAVRAEATEWGYEPRPEYILFELGLEQAVANEYQGGNPSYRRWRAP
ncbi:MAG: pyridoxamine 5'-phosphate oxidase [Actinomycetota bacterium]